MFSTKLQFLLNQNEYQTPELRTLPCNFLTQSHFDYACFSWYRIAGQKMRKKVQVVQNKCHSFCLKLSSKQCNV